MNNINLPIKYNCRYFNKLIFDGENIIKQSVNKEKLKNEYNTYMLLPDSIKEWFITPFDFLETKEYVSYKMKYYPIENLGFQYVKGLLTLYDMEKILDKLFCFINTRNTKKMPNMILYDKLYINKLETRVSEFKKNYKFTSIENRIKNMTSYSSFDDIIQKYKTIYLRIKQNKKLKLFSVVGHGDLCFSNILYDKNNGFMIFIDPKDFRTNQEMWLDPYYDIAKLSHSICGNYEFFILKKYNVLTNNKLNFSMSFDNNEYIQLFKKYLLNNDFDYNIVRILEVSLFLSMLPLHIDDENRMLGFILNAINIMDKLETNC